MRWFKHMTSTTSDEKIMELLELGGMEAYGFYWRLVELIAQQIDKNSSTHTVTLALPTLSRQCYLHHNKVTKLLGKVAETELIKVSKVEVKGKKKIEISCPNLLKYRDEYSKKKSTKKAKTPDKLQTDNGQSTAYTETETETETDINISKISAIKPPLTSGKISHSAETIQKFADALGAFSISEVEKANVSVLIDKGCLPEDVASAKSKNPQYMKSLKSEWQMRCVIAARDERLASKSRNQTQKEVLEELERTYGKGLQVVC